MIRKALELFTVDEILEMCNVDAEEALEYLINAGLLELPPFLEQEDLIDHDE